MLKGKELVIPVAGKGTRLNYSSAKCLFPINGIPIIGHIINEHYSLFDKIIVVVSPEFKGEIERYLLRFKNIIEIQTVIQPEPRGMADAIWRCKENMDSEYTTVIWGDQALIRKETMINMFDEISTDDNEIQISIPLYECNNPYVSYNFSEGKFKSLTQSRENQIMPERGLSDAGLFTFQTNTLLEVLANKEYKNKSFGAQTKESNFLQFIECALLDGYKYKIVKIDKDEAPGINTPEEAEKVELLMKSRKKKVVQTPKLKICIFSGGRGTSNIIKSLINLKNLEITVLINGYDDGLSTGRIREYVGGMLGPSDFRKNLSRFLASQKNKSKVSLAKLIEWRLPNEENIARLFINFIEDLESSNLKYENLYEEFKDLFELIKGVELKDWLVIKKSLKTFFEFEKINKEKFGYSDCAIGNIVIAGAFLESKRNFNDAIDYLVSKFDVSLKILNITDGENLYLSAIKSDGQILTDEAAIVEQQNKVAIKEILLFKEKYKLKSNINSDIDKFIKEISKDSVLPNPNKKALDALENANFIIYGPGTQHSSLFPSYLTIGVAESIVKNNKAEKIFIGNVKTDNEIEVETVNTLCIKLHHFLSRRGEFIFKHKDIANRYFIQRPSFNEPNQIPFDKNKFLFEYDQLLLEDWELGVGKHRGGMIIGEISNLVLKFGLQISDDQSHDIISFILPVLNEEKTIAQVIQQIDSLDCKKLNLQKEIIIVDGGSEDKTVKSAKDCIKKLNLTTAKIVSSVPNNKRKDLGRGFAIQHGLKIAKGDIITIYPADDEFKISDLEKVLNSFINNNESFVIGSRSIKGYRVWSDLEKIYRGNLMQQFISLMGGRLITIGLFITSGALVADPISNVRVIKKSALLNLNVKGNGINYMTNMVKKAGLKKINIKEIAIEYFPRTKNEGKKTRILDGLISLWSIAFD